MGCVEAPGGDWATLPTGPLACIFHHLSTRDLVKCASVCKNWDHTLQAATPWHCALSREHGYPGPESGDAKQLLVAARTGQLWTWGGNVLGMASCRLNRFTSPQPLLLAYPPSTVPTPSSGGSPAAPAMVVQPAPATGQPSSHANVRAAVAATDFAVLLTWDGDVIDSRALGPRPQQAQHRNRPLAIPQQWRPPDTAIVQVAAGGCWQGSGKDAGGHVLALGADGSVWGWGSNRWGQLGAGTDAEWVAAPEEVLGAAAAEALGRGVAQLSCGEAHSGLLLQSGAVAVAGCNSRGACGGVGQDLERVPVFCQAALPHGTAGRRLSCGGHNSAVVTTGGRLLVCGDNEFGQCGGGAGRIGACCWEFADVGPDARWHGMLRVNQQAAGGGGQAAARVVDVCCGNGSMYALTDAGEVFAWGQGGQGELGLGGSCKNIASPSKLSWAHDIVSISAAAGGRFAAVVDSHGKLLTFGAGKFGQLGHGDTNKRAVGRPVKALQHTVVRNVVCGADFIVALTCWKAPPGGRGNGMAGGKGVGRAKAPPPEGATPPLHMGPAGGGGVEGEGEETTPPPPSFRYREVDPGTPTRLYRQRSGLLAALLADPLIAPPHLPSSPSSRIVSDATDTPRSDTSSLFPDTPSTSATGSASLPSFGDPSSPLGGGRRRHHNSSNGGSHPTGASLGSSEGAGGGRRAGRGRRWVPPDPEAAVQRRRRWMAEPPTREGHCSGGEEGEGREGGGGSDRHFRYLLRRQLKVFASSPQQRELSFPPSLSSSDRYKIHIMAEAWGMMHQSFGEGAERSLLVWKPSHSRRCLKPGMGPPGVAEGGDAGAPGVHPSLPSAAGVSIEEPGMGSLAIATGVASSEGEDEGGDGDGELLEEEVLYAQAADSGVV